MSYNSQPVLNPESYDGARVLEASGRPLLAEPIQEVNAEPGTKLARKLRVTLLTLHNY